MRHFLLAAIILALTVSTSSAATRSFVGLKFGCTVEEAKQVLNTTLTPMPEEQRPAAKDLQYYYTDNVQMDGKDLGSLFLGFNKATGKLYSIDFHFQFFDRAKRSKPIKMQEGHYMMMGKTEHGEEYFQMLYDSFTKHYGKPKQETYGTGDFATLVYKWDDDSNGYYFSMQQSKNPQAKMTVLGCVLLSVQ